MYLNSQIITNAIRAYRLALYADTGDEDDPRSAPDPASFFPGEMNYEDFCWLCRTGLTKQRPDAGSVGTGVDMISCDLHVFFINIEENEDHLRRLRGYPEPKAKKSVAKSKIATTNLAEITPVDRVAARVVDLSNS